MADSRNNNITKPPPQRPLPPSTAPQPPTLKRLQTEPEQPPKPKRLRWLPLKGRNINTCRFFKNGKKNDTNYRSKHQSIRKVEREVTHIVDGVPVSKKVYFWYKKNPPGSPMSEIEACNWAFYNLLVPNRVPRKANAHYDDNGVPVGVSLEDLAGFVPVMEDSLKDHDLHEPNIVLGLAEGLTASWIFAEDDCHRCNISKDGKRVDFDNSNYPVTGQFKFANTGLLTPAELAESKLRPYDVKYYPVSEIDAVQFPDLTVSQHFYWPTKSGVLLRDKTIDFIENWTKVSLSRNAFTEEENPNYIKLKKMPLFMRRKFHVLLKFILLPDKVWQAIARQHIRDSLKAPFDNKKKASDLMSDFIIQRKAQFREMLVNLPEFQDFLLRHGETSLEKIIAEINERNTYLLERADHKRKKNPHHKTEEYFDTRINPYIMRSEFKKIKMEVNHRYAEGREKHAQSIATQSAALKPM